MKMNLDHVAFIVESVGSAVERLGLSAEEPTAYPSEGTLEAYLGDPSESARILLIEPIGDGPYTDAMTRRGPGLHHVALRVDDLDAFIDQYVDGSGWLLHPRSLKTRREANTVWLTRPGVEALIEVHQGEPGEPKNQVESVTIAGLDQKPGLATVFAECGVDVVAGPVSGVQLAGRFVSSPDYFSAENVEYGDAYDYNREAWNQLVRSGNQWTVGVDAEEIARARQGVLKLLLTPTKFIPIEWLADIEGKDVLCLASGGGQQGPLLAAAGANVTVFDASDEQLARDKEVAIREGLEVRVVRGDMRDLSVFADATFDLVVHPCSNCFVAEIAPVWREAARVLRPGGALLAGFNNSVSYCFDWGSVERGTPMLRNRLPYRDLDNLQNPFVAKAVANNEPLEFSHTLRDQLGGQTDAGLAIVGLYEDSWGNEFPTPYFDGFIATRAIRL